MTQTAQGRVLIVDDEIDFVEALAERLETRGLTVCTANDGPTAIKMVTESRFDAIVLDLAMPGMDGIETLNELRRLSPDVQVILLTGHATLETGIKATRLGALDFLEKPVDINTLIERIREASIRSAEAAEAHTQQLIDDILKTKGW